MYLLDDCLPLCLVSRAQRRDRRRLYVGCRCGSWRQPPLASAGKYPTLLRPQRRCNILRLMSPTSAFIFLEDRLPFCLIAREISVIAAAATSIAVAVRGNSSVPCKLNADALPRAIRRFSASSAHICEAA
jgi:hypothetical protein